MKNALQKLQELGQSPWYDNIERRLIKNGELKRLFDNGITGVTSNPTIFQKAVESSGDYDDQIKELIREGKDVRDIYDKLTMKDVASAADLLHERYVSSGGMDGLVSIEVPPEYAHDAQKTIACARALFERIKGQNILIKVPGTPESPEAIRTLISEGVNVNVTLLFSLAQYERQAQAYIAGLKDALAKDRDISKIRSVASVFVSRIDTKIDAMLNGISAGEELKGKAAVANSKMIYRRFKEIFFGEEFSKLKERGAHIQRVVWASTSTKNPAYRDVKYVEELIGENTINTMPHATVEAFLEHGKVSLSLEEDAADAKKTLDGLKSAGISIESCCEELQREGVKAFAESFDSLIRTIESIRAKVG